MPVTWIASYPKSGNTWVRFLLANATGERATLLQDLTDRIPFVQAVSENDPRIDSPEGLMVKTHRCCSGDMKLGTKTGRAIYVIRDPRDVLLSTIRYMPLRAKSMGREVPVWHLGAEEYARRFIRTGGDPQWSGGDIGPWAQNAASWTQEASFPVLTVRYEDLTTNAERELAGMLEFLGRPADEATIRRAVERSSFERLRQSDLARREQAGLTTDESFFAAGSVGGRLDSIADGLDDFFDTWLGEKAARFGYPRTGAPQGS